MADIDLQRVYARLAPLSQWRLNQTNTPHYLVEWKGPDPEPTQAEIDAEWALIEAEDAARLALETQAQNDYDAAIVAWQSMPTWAKTFTDPQIDAWVAANITDMASAKLTIAEILKVQRKVIDLMRINYLE